jgi:hypothetical protein
LPRKKITSIATSCGSQCLISHGPFPQGPQQC